jgi:peptidoglycan/LPS O-acetylase OafA/YrhL
MTDGSAGTGGTDWLRAGRARPLVAAAADVAWLVAFVLLGRSSHTEGESVAGVARTLWPFLVGLALGWAGARAWRQPARVVPTGVVVWPVCVAAAMALRAASGQGVAVAFVGVALAFVGLGLLGWRIAAGLGQRRRATGPAPG